MLRRIQRAVAAPLLQPGVAASAMRAFSAAAKAKPFDKILIANRGEVRK
jgi:hypothetical protein